MKRLVSTSTLVATLTALAPAGAAPGAPGVVDRTPDFAVARPVAAPVGGPVDVPLMPGIRLNISRATVLRQEGPGLAKRQFPHDRYREPGRPLAPGHRAQPEPNLAESPTLDYRGRRVFGMSAFQWVYTANPHTGLYDTLSAGMLAPDPAAPRRFERFHAVRATLVERLGPPEKEAFYVSAARVGEVVRREDLTRPPVGSPPPGFAVARWRTGELSLELTTEYGGPTRDTRYALGLYVWCPSAEPNYTSGVHRDWSGFVAAPLPGPRTTVLYRPPAG